MKRYILFSIITLWGAQVFGQTATEVPNFSPKSPEAAAFLKYGEYPVDLSTGVPNISIPIYTVKSGSYELPITLSYHASGIKVEEDASWVGLGWNLNFGAQIVLEVRDAPDEYNTGSYDDIPDANDVNNYIANNPINGYYHNYILNMRNESWVRDVYNFSSPTVSGKFIIDKRSPLEITVYPPDAFKVENYIGGNGSGRRFKITDIQGNVYIFNNTREKSQTLQQYQEMDYTSAWFVDRIETPNNDTIIFEYQDGGEVNQISYGEVINHTKITNPNYVCMEDDLYKEIISPIQNNQTTLHTYTKKIKKISFRGGRLLFNSVDDRVDTGSIRLDNIEIQAHANDTTFQTIKKYKFFHSYFIANAPESATVYQTHRLRLDKISNLLGIDAPEETEFSYSSVKLPAKDSKATDYWGYYNGKANTSRIPHQFIPFSPHGISTGYESIGNADRRVDATKSEACILKEIKYPTKGITKFEYEPNMYYGIDKLNKYSKHEISDSLIGTGIGSGNPNDVMEPGIDDNLVCTSPNPNNCLQIKIVPFTSINAKGVFKVHILNDDTLPESEMHYRYARVRLFNSIGNLICDAHGHSTQQFTFDLNNLNSGWIQMEVWGQQLRIDQMNLTYYNNEQTPKNNYGMGLRIKSITNFDSDNTTQVNKKMYEYNQSADINKSSGKLIKDISAVFRTNEIVNAASACCPPNVGVMGCMWKTSESVSYVSNSISGIEGNSIAYSEVVEKSIDTDGNPNGYTKYEFTVDEDILYDTRGIIKVEMGHKRGRLLSKEVYKTENGNPYIVNKQTNQYFEDDRRVALVKGFKLFQNYYLNTNPVNDTLPIPLDAILEPVSYNIPVKWFYLKSSQNTDYFYDSSNLSTGVIVTNKTYNYNNPLHLQLSSEETQSSIGMTLLTKYFYPQDPEVSTEPFMSDLVEKNIICVPILTQSYRDALKISEQKTKYNEWQGLYLPEIIQTSKGSQPLENRIRFSNYDKKGNPLEVQRENGTVISYIWGYDRTKPIAKIENATNAQVATALGTTIENTDESQMVNINALRGTLPLAMVTTFTYNPLIGISSITDPKSMTTYFEYDNLGRLAYVEDNEGNKLSQNEYHYADETIAQNFIKNTIYKDDSGSDKSRSITYFDGLGRPIQQIAEKQSASGKDIVTHIEYDGYGRQAKEYLPFASTQTNLAYIDSGTLPGLVSTQYQALYGAFNDNPYSEKLFETSPLNRVLKQAAPGGDWALGNNHEVQFDYQTNDTGEVLLYNAVTSWNSTNEVYEPDFESSSYYDENELYKTITKNENWTSGNDNTTEEFKDKEGRVVLKRTYESGNPHDTYYVYDEYGNLTYVLPPVVDTNSSITQDVLDNVCYQYKYDHRNRLVEKKLPGTAWQYIAYNTQDMPFATGPSLDPFGSGDLGTMITKYDVFGRVIYTGWNPKGGAFTASDRAYYQDMLGTSWKESYLSSPTILDSKNLNYTNTTYPTGTGLKIMTINYYDNYSFDGAPTPPATVEGQAVLGNVKGLATGNWVRVNEASNTLIGNLSYTIYDKKGRPIQNRTNNYLGGYTNVNTQLDFVGKTKFTKTTHKRISSSATTTVRDDYSYTQQERLLQHNHTINNLPTENIAKNTYSELGQLIRKGVGNDTIKPWQEVDYKYNIRGWLTNINNIDSLEIGSDPKDLFAFKINYNDDIDNNLSHTVMQLYNGNIAETDWRTSTDDVKRRYGYSYDNLNRLRKATYQKPDNTVPVTKMYDEEMTYDKNGNIQTLIRNGDFDSNTLGAVEIDNLEYEYDPDKINQLFIVTDSSNSPKGFKEGGSGKYYYDDFGNMIEDQNKGIETIVYNHLNLPTQINFTNGNKIEYLYDAVGKKMRKKVWYGTDSITTDYLDGFQYVDGGMVFFPHAEGYVNVRLCVECETPKNVFNYVYQYKDHLGNIRVNYGYDEMDEAVKIMEENHYYPFGLKHTQYNVDGKAYEASPDDPEVTIISELPPGDQLKNKYKYNGKEYQDELGLNMYAMDMRLYDPAIGRWTVIDPVTHHSESPYSAFINNPVYWKDPSGANSQTSDLINELFYMTPNDGNAYTYTFTNTEDPKQKTTTDAGHGDKTGCCVDPGTTDGSNYEKDYALKVEQSVNSWLNAWGIDNQSTRTGDIDKTGQKKIAWRLKAAKEHGSIIMVSIHIDSGGKDGLFVLYDKDNSESKLLAQSIANNYSFGLGDPDGIKEDVRNLGIVQRFSGKASVLLELGGIANKNMRDRINTNSELMGYDIARGMYLYLNGTEPPTTKTPATNTTQSPWQEIFPFLNYLKF